MAPVEADNALDFKHIADCHGSWMAEWRQDADIGSFPNYNIHNTMSSERGNGMSHLPWRMTQ